MSTKQTTIIFLAFPILCISAWLIYQQILSNTGQEVLLNISSYDPRDLLRGHYLTYRIDYGVPGLCESDWTNSRHCTYVCLDSQTASTTRPQNCKLMIKGKCKYGQLLANVERFYIPESRAADLDQRLRDTDNHAQVLLRVRSGGQARVIDVLINGDSALRFTGVVYP